MHIITVIWRCLCYWTIKRCQYKTGFPVSGPYWSQRIIFIALQHTLETTDIPASFPHLGYGKFYETVSRNICLNALHLTTRKFCVGQGLQASLLSITHTFPSSTSLHPSPTNLYYNGNWGRSPITFFCSFQMFFSINLNSWSGWSLWKQKYQKSNSFAKTEPSPNYLPSLE